MTTAASVERRIGAGAVLAQQWDPLDRIAAQTVWGAPTPGSSDARLLQHRAYAYAANGTVTATTDRLAGDRRYDTDPRGRVTAVRAENWSERYAYDDAGNLAHAQWPSADAEGGATARTPGRSSAAPGARGWSTTRTGTITRRERRTLWGVPSETVAECPLGFPGQYLDRETGLYYNFQRYYDPALGRYASPDVLGLAPQPNPHAYVTDPRTWYDPLGLNPCTTAGRDDLLKAANANAKGKGLTAAGRAQQKHGDTNPNNVAKRGAAHVQRYDFGKANNKERNEVGDEMVQEILTDPTAVETIDTNAPAHYGGVQRDIRIPGSWGARWSNRGGNLTFEGFL